jgi:hypothetical protein
LGEITKYTEVVPLELDAGEAISFLFQEYKELFRGIVIYDTTVPETINLASMIAALEDRIIVGPHQLQSQPFDTMMQITDLRILVQQQGWQADFESQLSIYQWVYDSLWPSLEHRIIGFSSPGPPTSIDRETVNDGFYFPLDITHRDYDIALKLPVLYLNPKYDDHLDLLEKFFSEAPAPAPILGVTAFNEFGVVATASRFGHFVPAINWPGQSLSCGNLTILSAIRPRIIKNGPDLDPTKILATVQETGPFVTLFSSDGDALFFQMDRGF